MFVYFQTTSFGLKGSDIIIFVVILIYPDLKQILYFNHNNQEVCGIMLHVVNDFKLNLDFLCSVGKQAAAEHVQLLKICAHLLMICKVCCFYCFSPRVYCVHVRDYFSVLFVNEA